MTTPAILSSVPRESWSVEPRPVAVIPSATKTTVKARQKTIAGSSTRARSPRCSSPIVTPETADR